MKALRVILMLLISGACVWGWVMNFINLITGYYEETMHLVLGLAGIFVAPLGIFMGWLM